MNYVKITNLIVLKYDFKLEKGILNNIFIIRFRKGEFNGSNKTF